MSLLPSRSTLHSQSMQFSPDRFTLSRRQWFAVSPLLGSLAAVPFARALQTPAPKRLSPPATGSIPVAFPISKGAVLIDFSGPWEVFQDVNIPSREDQVFHLYTVAEDMKPVTASGGMKILPNYTFADAPAPKVIVIPAQSGNDAMLNWIRKSFPGTDVTMSVCTGAFLLAQTGLLDGKPATTHHGAYAHFAMQYGSKVQLKRGARFVDDGQVASAGGLTSGIDLAMHVVERYFGRDVAINTANYMEYQGEGWKDESGLANAAYLTPANDSQDPVCHMPVDASAVNHSEFRGKTYYFCSKDCKAAFDGSPESFVNR